MVSFTKEQQGANLLMELGGLVRHVCIEGIEYLRRHGSHSGDVWMVQFRFFKGRLEEFIVIDETSEAGAKALAYMFLGEIPLNAIAAKMDGQAAQEARKRMDARPAVV